MAEGKDTQSNRGALYGISGAIILGFVVVVLFSTNASTLQQFFVNVSVGLLAAGACSMAGGLFGFLFGIPRALQVGDTSSVQSVTSPQSASAEDQQVGSYRSNTNLEQISDWLTKILVGVGLTQLTVLPEKLHELGSFLAPALGGSQQSNAVAVSLVMYFVISGFLFSYLWTRLYLGKALHAADVAAIGKKLNELEMQTSLDAKALSLVQQQLNPRTDSPKVSEKELRDAIMGCSPAVKTTVFYQAWEVRSKSWQDNGTKPLMERTIPIFRALADSDSRNEYHSNHGQLSFALKDKQNPDWSEAEKEVTKAIEIRGDWRKYGWLYYEFNRAICRIHLEEESEEGRRGLSPNREKILEDLRAAASNDYIREKIEGDQHVRDWMRKNKITMESLRL